MKLTCTLITIGVFFIEATYAGWPNFVCPSATNQSVYFPCNLDCKYQHGADYGYCGDPAVGNYNCYCGALNGKRYEPSLMCAEDNLNYYKICEVDCQCSHGAVGGICDFKNKACQCYGYDSTNSLCPHNSVETFAIFIAQMAGTEGMVGAYVRPYLPPGFIHPRPLDLTNVNKFVNNANLDRVHNNNANNAKDNGVVYTKRRQQQSLTPEYPEDDA